MNTIKKVANFYIDGFKSMKLGKKLWVIVAIKIFVLFVIIKLLFFPNILQEQFKSDKARSNYILEQLTGE
jgi:hypothetical protein